MHMHARGGCLMHWPVHLCECSSADTSSTVPYAHNLLFITTHVTQIRRSQRDRSMLHVAVYTLEYPAWCHKEVR